MAASFTLLFIHYILSLLSSTLQLLNGRVIQVIIVQWLQHFVLADSIAAIIITSLFHPFTSHHHHHTRHGSQSLTTIRHLEAQG